MNLAQAIHHQQRESLYSLLAFFGGSQAELARRLNVSRQCVHAWMARGRISKDCAVLADKITKRQIKKEDLRPDVVWSGE